MNGGLPRERRDPPAPPAGPQPDLRSDRRPALQDDAERAIAEALREIRYGSVEIVIQNSRVVQIERREKTRFDLAEHGGRKSR